MATTYVVTFSGAVSAAAPGMFDTAQAKNPSGMLCTGLGQETGKADGVTVNSSAIGGAPVVVRVDTDGLPNTP